MIKIKGNKTCIFGHNQSGKTTLCKYLIKQTNVPTFIYDWHDEYGNLKGNNIFTYVPKFKSDIEKRNNELDIVLRKVIKGNKIKLIVIDEANEYAPAGKPLPDILQDLNDNHAHYGNMGIIWIARRPYSLKMDLVDLASNRIFFILFGAGDLNYCQILKENFKKSVSNLKPYHFVNLDMFGNIQNYKPVPMV